MMDELELDEMRSIVSKLNEASDAYYNGKGEIMSDFEWDALFDRLKKMEAETGTVLPDSPTNKVSADTTEGEKEAHEFSALSLAKTKKPEDLVKWAEGKPIWISWKLDGLTLVVTYDNGKLTKVVTRGDGHIGTNITRLAKAINGIPQSVSDRGHLVIRGEAVISYEDFERFVLESDSDYANPRNLASGSLSLKDAEEVRKRNINWIPFTLVHTDKNIDSWGARMDYLESLGFKTVEHEKIEDPTLESIKEEIGKWTLKVTERVNPYPVDGLVIAYDDTVYAEGGSVTGHHATRAGFAFKWQDESAETVLDHIEWSCAASTITPVAVFEGVELEGTTVRRASLCNISECERLKIGGKGSVLSVIKANKIIPKVIEVKNAAGSLEIPEKCPVCGEPTEIRISEVSGTKTLVCTNSACPAKKLKKYTRFVSKAGMDIDGISEQTISRFVNLGWIKNFGDIFRLKDHIEEISALEGFGAKSASNINASLEKSAIVSGRKFLYALNIPLIGADVAGRLLDSYPLDELIKTAEDTDDETVFSSIDGIGPEKSKAFVSWIKDPGNRRDLEDLLTLVSIERQEIREKGEKCAGLVFVVTGDVYKYKNRNELKAYIESQGGKVTGSVSGSTNFLINNDTASLSTKNTRAKQLGIPVISEDEFIERFT